MTYVFNTTIAVPSSLPASFEMREINATEASNILKRGFTSAVGHEASAQALTEVTGVTVPFNRIQAAMEVGDTAVCFKLRGRLQEGQILDRKQVDEIGYDLVLMERVS